jgi:hypothetical protein
MADASGNIDPADGAAFDNWDVARSYAFRTPYPPVLFDFLLQRLRRRERALDLGSGPGKISRAIAPNFKQFVAHWLGKLGKAMNEVGFRANLDAYKRWMDVDGHVTFSMIFEQWSRARMGGKLAAKFDADLRDLLMPYAVDGVLRYSVRSGLVYGKPRATQLEGTNG